MQKSTISVLVLPALYLTGKCQVVMVQGRLPNKLDVTLVCG